MSKILWNSLLISPAVLGAALVVSSTAMAADGSATAGTLKDQAAETKVSEKSDVLAATPEATAASLAAPQETVAINQDLKAATLTASPDQASALQLSDTAVKVNTSVAATLKPEVAPTVAVEPSQQAVPSQPEVLAQTAASQDTNLEQLNRYSNEGSASTEEGQVTSVSQLSDVQPTDWAFQALQSLVERYGCIAGYPDGTYRGNRAMTRYEFAAGLNACLDRINELIASATADLVTREDLAALQRLQEEFAAELATLRGRVDALEARTAELEANQFSTTTKLTGEAIFNLSNVFGSNLGFKTDNNQFSENNESVFQHRVRLNLNTSFTGRDLLLTRLQVGNAQRFGLGITSEGTQTTNIGESENTFKLDSLLYQFPVSDRLNVTIAANAGIWDDIIPTVNPYFEDFDGGNGSLSAFGQRNPIYRLGGGSGIGFSYDFGKPLGGLFGPTSLSGGYLASQAANPTEGKGVFNGDYAAMAQLTFTPTRSLQVALSYNHGYFERGNFGFDNGLANGRATFNADGSLNESNLSGLTGTGFANSLYGLTEGLNTDGVRAKKVVSNSYGVQLAWAPSRSFVISGWGGLTQARLLGLGDSSIWTYAVNIGFPDLFKEGNFLGFVLGREPYLGKLDVPDRLNDGLPRDSSWHIEAFYKFQVTDNISVTPGVIWITNPNQDDTNDDIIVGTLRTTFTF